MEIQLINLLKRPKLNLSVILLFTIFLGFQLPRIQLDNDVTKFLPDDHPVNKQLDEEEALFGSSDIMVIALENTQGSIFSREFVSFVTDLTRFAEELNGVDEVESLTNVDYIRTIPGGMDVSPLVGDDFSGNDSELMELKEKLLSWEVYKNVLYSDDFSSTQVAITLIPDIDPDLQEEIYFALKDYLVQHLPDTVNHYIAGNPSVLSLISVYMKEDLKSLIPMVIVVLIFFLFLFFKRVGGVVLPLLAVLISTVWTIGIMALLEIPLSIVSTAIPVLMVAVGSAYGIHVVSHYYDELKQSQGTLDHEGHIRLVHSVMKSVGVPVLTASLTTLAGFASLAVSRIIPLRYFGIFTAVGVFVAMIVSLVMIPSILILRHSSSLKEDSSITAEEHSATEKIFTSASRFLGSNTSRLIVMFIAVISLSFYGINHLIVDNSLIEFFKMESEIRQSEKFMSKHFVGTESFSVILEGSEPGSMAYPEILEGVNDLTEYLQKKYDVVTKITSFSDFVMRMNQVMNDPEGNIPMDDGGAESTETDSAWDSGGWDSFSSFSSFVEEEPIPAEDVSTQTAVAETPGGYDLEKTLSYADFCNLLEKVWVESNDTQLKASELIQGVFRELNRGGADYFEVPGDPEKYNLDTQEDLKNLISQYLLLFSGDLDRFTDDGIEPSKIRVKVTLKTTGSRLPHEIMEDAAEYAGSHFPENIKIWTSGLAKAKFAVTNLIVSTQIHSIILSLILVFLIVTIQFRSLPIGLISIVPLSFSILINFGVMGLFGIKLDIGTAIVASVAIGIGIDYTIHFLSGYFQLWHSLPDPTHRDVMDKLWMSVGKAIIFNALSVAAGFFVLAFSNFYPLIYLGILIVLTMLTSSLGSLTVLPAIIKIINPAKLYKEK